jgi:heptosyltransferase-2
VQHFLIIQTAFLGDVILATPLFSELKRIYPNAQVHVLVRKGNEALVSTNPYIDRLFVWNKKEGKYRSMRSIIRQLREFHYDEVINLQRYTSSAIITWFCKARIKIGFDSAAWGFVYDKKIPHRIGDGRHEIKRNLQTIDHHGASSLKRPELFPSQEDEQAVSIYKTVGDYYCMAPASVWFTKQLPENKWMALIRELTAEKKTVYLLGGPDDKDLCDRLANDQHLAVNLAGRLSLMQSAALMKDARRNYVNDSAPLHMASAMNAPVTAFFCSTTPNFGFGPLSEDRQIVEVSESLDCKPCGIHGHSSCPKKHFKCGEDIDLSLVKKGQVSS